MIAEYFPPDASLPVHRLRICRATSYAVRSVIGGVTSPKALLGDPIYPPPELLGPAGELRRRRLPNPAGRRSVQEAESLEREEVSPGSEATTVFQHLL